MKEEKLLSTQVESSKEENNLIILPRTNRLILYFFILILNISFFIILGVLPVSVKDIKSYYSLSDIEFGLINSFFYAGKIIGCLLFIFLFTVIKRKLLLLINISLNFLGIFLMVNATSKPILYFCFFPIGIANAFAVVYFPIWCDQYGLRRNKAKFLTFLQISLRTGIIIGQLLTPLFGWKKSLYIDCFIGISGFLVVLLVDGKYFSDKIYSALNKEEDIKNSEIQSVFTDISKKENKGDNKENNNFKSILSKFLSNFNLFKNKIYIIYIIARSFIFYPVTILGAWEYDYVENVFGITSKAEKIKYLSSISISSYISGLIVGGFTGDLIGNYGSFKSSFILFCSYLVACIFYQILPLVNTIRYFCIIEWFALFFHALIMPNLTGLIISSVEIKLKASASSMSSLMSNTIGHMPAPYLYGLLKEKYPEYNRFPMKVLCSFAIVAEIFFGLGCLIKYKINKQIEEDKIIKENNEKEGKELENV